MERRHFLQNLALSAAATGVASSTFSPSLLAAAGAAGAGKRKNKLCIFSKHLQGLSFDEIAGMMAEAGVDGVEAPIRPGGHVEPERVEEDLPKFVEALKKQGLELMIMTSGVNQVSAEQRTEPVLRTAAALGVKRFRMSYFKYDLNKPIWPQLEEVKPKIKDLVQLCSEIGIQPLFQNHSGKDYFAAPVWDMYSIMREYPAEQFAFAFDILHATAEGGLSWPLEAALVADHMGAIYFKDFQWQGRKLQTCPLGQGQVNPDFAKWLRKRNYEGVISLHLEYLKGSVKDPDFLKESREAATRDVGVLCDWMGWA